MFWRSSLVALAAGAIGLASAQVSGPYTDPQNGIAYQQFYTPVAGGYSFAMALPTNPTNEFIGKLEGPVGGWSGVSLGGNMANSLLVVAWVNKGSIVHSFRLTASHTEPAVYKGPAATTMHQSVNATHFSWTFRCRNCLQWGKRGVNASGDSVVFGWDISSGPIANRADPGGVLPSHNVGKGLYRFLIGRARSSLYQSWISRDPAPSGATPSSAAQVLGEADYIVVGGGAGGLVAADRLSEGGASVVLIERGPPATYAQGGRIQPGWLRGHRLTRFDVPGLCNEIWRNSTGIACEDIDRMAGCVLGGGTAVNSGMFFVPPDRDWDYNFPAGWKAADMAAARRRLFARIPSTSTPSRNGRSYLQEAYEIVGAAARKAGWREVAINAQPNDKNRTFGHSPSMFSGGERGGPLATYLVSAEARPNFKLVLYTMARRVVRAGSIASAVEVYATGPGGQTGVYRLKPGGRVVLSAGAFGTAKVLFRSGIGPQDQLEIVRSSALDGPTMISPAHWIRSPVGRNLVDHTDTDLVVSHPNIRAYDFYAAFNDPIPADRDAYLDSRSGVLATAAPGIPLVLFDAVAGTDGITRQLQWTVRAEGSRGQSGPHLVTLSQYVGTGVTSRGRIVIRPNLAMTVGVAPHATTAADKAAIIQGVQNMLAAITAWSANGTRITLHKPAPGQSAADYVNSYTGDRSANHWLGSARLGTDDGTRTNGDSGSVVDLNTKVYGTANIFIVDASIFPGQLSTNPSAPIMVAAEHAVERIKALPNAKKYEQCGGLKHVGPTKCDAPYVCKQSNDFYSQCV